MEAIFYKKTKQLYIFSSKNTAEYVNCGNLESAKIKIKNSGINQTLKINNK